MQCNPVLYHVTSCQATPSNTIPRHSMQCNALKHHETHTMSCNSIQHQATQCHIMTLHSTSATLYHATPYRTIPCNAMPHHAIQRHSLLCNTLQNIPHHATPWCHIMSSNGILCHSTPCLASQRRTTPCNAMSHHATISCHAMP